MGEFCFLFGRGRFPGRGTVPLWARSPVLLGSFGKQDVLIPAPGGPSNFMDECHENGTCMLSVDASKIIGPKTRQEAPHAIFEGCDLMARIGCPLASWDVRIATYFPLLLWTDHSYMDPVCTRRSSSRTWDPCWDPSLSCPFWDCRSERNLDSSYSLFTVACVHHGDLIRNPATLSCEIFPWHFRWLGWLLHLRAISQIMVEKKIECHQQNIDFVAFPATGKSARFTKPQQFLRKDDVETMPRRVSVSATWLATPKANRRGKKVEVGKRGWMDGWASFISYKQILVQIFPKSGFQWFSTTSLPLRSAHTHIAYSI